MFGVDDRGQRQQPLDQRLARLVVEQDGAALGDHHRVDDDRRLADAGRAPRPPPRWSPPSPSIPILTASTPMSSATARTWATIISGATASTALDPDRVLRRDRGDRGHPVHAAARERLQVGLDAGAAAGVRAGDREDGGDARSAVIGAQPR